MAVVYLCTGFSIGFAVCSIIVLRRKRIIIDKLVAACKAVQVRIAFIGHPNEPWDWAREVALIEAALAYAKEKEMNHE